MYSDLLPITALIRREFISSLRQSRYFYLMLAAVTVAGFFVLGSWPQNNPMPGQMRAASRDVFMMLTLTLGVGAAVSVPAMSGSSIVSEREEDTFELLAMTTARPWHVLVAKLLNAAGHYLLLLVALMPFAACVFFLVGVNTDVLWRTLMLVSSTALACAAAGVLCSARLSKPMHAIGASYLAMIAITGLAWLLPIVVLIFAGFPGYKFLSAASYVVPIVALPIALGETFGTVNYCVEICSAIYCGVAIALLLLAHVMVRRNWGMSILREGYVGLTPRRRTRDATPPRRSFVSERNPVYLRESWYEYRTRGWMGVLQIGLPFGLAFVATGLIAWIYAVQIGSGMSGWYPAFLSWHFLQAVLLPIIVVALTANMFTKEHERNNIDALRMTLLRPREIFTGKLLASLRVSFTLMTSAFVGSVFLLTFLVNPMQLPFNSTSSAEHLLRVFIMLAECLAVTWAATAFASLVTRKMASALVLSLGISTMALMGNALVVIFLGEVTALFEVDNWVGMFSPYLAFGLSIGNERFDSSLGWLFSHAIAFGWITLFLVLGRREFAARHMRDR